MLYVGCWSVCNRSILRRLKAIYIIAKESIHTAQTCVAVIKGNWLIPYVETTIGCCDKHRNTKINCVGKYNLVVSKDVVHTFERMWHIHVKGCGTHMPKNVAHTCQRMWHTHSKGCGTYTPKDVAHTWQGCGTHMPKCVAHTCQKMWHTHAKDCVNAKVCGTQHVKDVAHTRQGYGTHMPKNVAHTCQRTWYVRAKECGTHV
jgi:hypothetical protein